MLRLVGNRFGPVIRSGAVDRAARTLEWEHDMDELAARRRKPRFVREPEPTEPEPRPVVKR